MIRMRVCQTEGAMCCSCSSAREAALELFEVQLAKGNVIVLCDGCMVQIRDKSIRACGMVSERTKSSHDMAIVRKRLAGTYIPEKRGKVQWQSTNTKRT